MDPPIIFLCLFVNSVFFFSFQVFWGHVCDFFAGGK